MKKMLSVILSVLFIFSASAVSGDVITETTETTVETFTVKFWGYDPEDIEIKYKDNKFLGEDVVPRGGAATPPTYVPEPEGYIFVGWDQNFSNVQDDMSINAHYVKITPTPIPPTATPKPTAKPTKPTETSAETTPTTMATESAETTTTETVATPTPTTLPTETSIAETTAAVPDPTDTSREDDKSKETDSESAQDNDPTIWIWIGVIGALVIGGVIVFSVLRRRKGKKSE